MRTPRWTDASRFRIPYKRAAASRAPGYLLRRFKMYRALMEKKEVRA